MWGHVSRQNKCTACSYWRMHMGNSIKVQPTSRLHGWAEEWYGLLSSSPENKCNVQVKPTSVNLEIEHMVSLTCNRYFIGWKLCNHHTPRYKHGEAWCDRNCRNVHNCRNTNHDCRKKHNCRNSNHNCCKPWSTTIVATPITNVAIVFNGLLPFSYQFCIKLWHSIQFSTILASLLTTRLWKLWNTVTYHKTMSQLSQFRDWNCDSCKILEILAMSYGKIATFATAQFLIKQLIN